MISFLSPGVSVLDYKICVPVVLAVTLFIVSILSSQIISNVPAAMMIFGSTKEARYFLFTIYQYCCC